MRLIVQRHKEHGHVQQNPEGKLKDADLQPRFSTNVAVPEVKEQGIGRGLNDIAIGLRLRYEIEREFAPYLGVTWQQSFGGTADLARDRGAEVGGWSLVAGIRARF